MYRYSDAKAPTAPAAAVHRYLMMLMTSAMWGYLAVAVMPPRMAPWLGQASILALAPCQHAPGTPVFADGLARLVSKGGSRGTELWAPSSFLGP